MDVVDAKTTEDLIHYGAIESAYSMDSARSTVSLSTPREADPKQPKALRARALKAVAHLVVTAVALGLFYAATVVTRLDALGASAADHLRTLPTLPGAAFILCFLVWRAGKGAAVWSPAMHTKVVHVNPKLWTALYLLLWVAYYALWLANPSVTFPSLFIAHARACVWNALLVVALASTAHLSMDAGRWYPLAALLLALPFVVPDRLPFSIEPAGCPTELHHMVATYGLVCSLWLLSCKDVRVSLMAERWRGWRPALTYGSTNNLLLAAGSGVRRAEPTLVVYWEVIPLLTAALSVCYLLTVLLGYPDLGASEYQAVWSGIYHTAWSYLRPMYVLTFALYYLKRQFLSAGEELWQAAACGFGFVFFWLLCPLVVSPSTEYDATCAHDTISKFNAEGTKQYHYTDGNGDRHPLVGHLAQSTHYVEAASFYLSMVLFIFHGLRSGLWEDSPTFILTTAVSTLCALLAVGLSSGYPSAAGNTNANFNGEDVELGVFDHLGTWHQSWFRYAVWAIIHYGVAYMCIIAPCVYILACRPRQLIVITSTSTS